MPIAQVGSFLLASLGKPMMGAERWLSLFGWPDVAEGAEQGEVVKDLQHPAGDQWQVLVPCREERPGQHRARRRSQAAWDGREARRCSPLCRCHDGDDVGGAGT